MTIKKLKQHNQHISTHNSYFSKLRQVAQCKERKHALKLYKTEQRRGMDATNTTMLN